MQRILNQRLVRRGAAALGLAICLSGMAACSNESPKDESAYLPEEQRVSSVPWNRPEGWEGRGSLGALANDPRFGGGH